MTKNPYIGQLLIRSATDLQDTFLVCMVSAQLDF